MKRVKEDISKVEEEAKLRLNNIRLFNEQNANKFHIDESKMPTEEDIKAAQKDYEDFVRDIQNRKDYFIADKENAVRVAKFLRSWIDTCFWSQRTFIGVINFADLLDKFIEESSKEPKDFTLEYAPMMFCNHILENYAGIGLDAAVKMSDLVEEYDAIYTAVHKNVEWYNAQLERAKDYQERWSMFQSGYWCDFVEPAADSSVNA